MGQDNSAPDFHQELLRLVQDPNPMVRRNAALALVRFGDASGLAEIRSMLQPSAVAAPEAGVLEERLEKPGESINPGTLLERIRSRQCAQSELRSQIPGTIDHWLVPDKTTVAAGQPVMHVNPSVDEIWEALRALYVIGEEQDLPAAEQFARGSGDFPVRKCPPAGRTHRQRPSARACPTEPARFCSPPRPARCLRRGRKPLLRVPHLRFPKVGLSGYRPPKTKGRRRLHFRQPRPFRTISTLSCRSTQIRWFRRE